MSCKINEYADELRSNARALATKGKGILAVDESTPTCGKRLADIGVENTEENRQAYRGMLFTTEGLGNYISGAILFEETLYQKHADGETMVEKLNKQMITLFSSSKALYESMLKQGVAKECARMVLPLCTPTRIYMTGSCRSWIHYINLRSAHGTQKEHMEIAEACRKVFTEQFPAVSEALEWV